MTLTIKPFQGYHYNTDMIPDLSVVTCPPYDVISPEEQDNFYHKNPYNFIRLILNKKEKGDSEANNTYSRAAMFFREWLKMNILIQDREEAFYVYQQDYLVNERERSRIGFIALMKLEDKAAVYPHENTHAVPLTDRFELIKKVHANLSPIFTIFSSEKKLLQTINSPARSGRQPDFSLKDEFGVRHSLWRLTDPRDIQSIADGMKNTQILIADGHHRYEVACRYRAFMQKEDKDYSEEKSYNYIMTYFTPLESEGITILPIHRLIKVSINIDSLQGDFEVKSVRSPIEVEEVINAAPRKQCVFGLYVQGKSYVLQLKDKTAILRDTIKKQCFKDLDVAYVDLYVLARLLNIKKEEIAYTKDINEAKSFVDNTAGSSAFILRPTGVKQIRDVALTRERMPPKSTYFYPKLLSGLVLHKFA